MFDVWYHSIIVDIIFQCNDELYNGILCVSFFVDAFRRAQTMAFAVTEINGNPRLLPNVTLGYILYDTCLTLEMAFRAALSSISGRETQIQLDEGCVGSPPVLGIVGDPSSANSVAVSSLLSRFRVPLVSCSYKLASFNAAV